MMKNRKRANHESKSSWLELSSTAALASTSLPAQRHMALGGETEVNCNNQNIGYQNPVMTLQEIQPN
jgi:hypothetical protein